MLLQNLSSEIQLTTEINTVILHILLFKLQQSVEISTEVQQILLSENWLYHSLTSSFWNWFNSVIRLIKDSTSCFISSQFTSINTSTFTATDFIQASKCQLSDVKQHEMKDQKHVRLIIYELNALNITLTNMLKQLKIKQEAQVCL